MALIQCSFASMTLHRNVNFFAVVPGDFMFPMPGGAPAQPLKTLYLLHGYTGCSADWLKSSDIGDISQQFNLAIIMPDGENHFYVNDKQRGDLYSDYIGRELVEFTRRVFPLSRKREDTIIGGISMGGCGAIINGLRFCDTFGHVVAISPALVYDDYKEATDAPNPLGLTRGYYESVFGPIENMTGTYIDPAWSAKHQKEAGKTLPTIYMATGRNDRLCIPARRLHEAWQAAGIDHVYEEGPGTHEAIFFYPHLRGGLARIPGVERMPEMPNPFWIEG